MDFILQVLEDLVGLDKRQLHRQVNRIWIAKLQHYTNTPDKA